MQIIARELGVVLRETLAQTLRQTSDLSSLLLETESRQILFIDEADEMDTGQQTLLYRALAEGKLFLSRGRSANVERFLPLDEFALVMATNHESKLARPLVERFRMVCRFEFYARHEILQLLIDRATALRWTIQDDVLPLIAERSRGVPRIGLRLLESVHRIARSENADVMTPAHFEQMCQIEGIDELGLDRAERAYLQILASESGPVRLNVLADHLGLPSRTIAAVVEPFLVREHLIVRLDDGRQLTPQGARHLHVRIGHSTLN